ncbi:MAG: group II intron reverse transcriptase/maturase, partial [Myxococcota bacterium]|nr:group II intron reverse transcriptase/maturase [Myxococcota bacterium]
FWGKSRSGKWLVRRSTAKDRFRRALARVVEWCHNHRHDDLCVQQRGLAQKLRGHFGYFGITGNFGALERFRHQVLSAWRKWLQRRSQRAHISWDRMNALLKRYPLPPPRIMRLPERRAANP